jgi:CRP-like cAMP-binding protein
MTQRVLDMAEPPLAGLRERLLVLRALDTLAGLDDAALTMLAEHARYRLFRKGEVLSVEDAPLTAIHIVIDGRITVMRGGVKAFVARNGDGLGVLPVIAGVPAGHTTADVDTRTLEIPAAAFIAALEDNFSLLRNELRLLAASTLSAQGVLPVSPPGSVLGAGTGEYPARAFTVVERVMRLRQGPFGVMSVDALSEFARRMVEVRIPADHVIWTVGESPAYTLHIHYGRVRCTAADGRHSDVGSPTMLGELDAWTGQNRTYEARTLTEVVAWRVVVEDVLMVLESHVQPAIQMLGTVARGLLSNAASSSIVLGAHRVQER